MKRRHQLIGLLAATTLTLSLTACGTNDAGSTTGASTTGAPSTTTTAGKTYTIASAVIISHPALQAVQDGFEEVLKEQGITYKMTSENAQGDPANATTIASSFASNKDIDLMLAISTPIALAIANAEKDRPILFSAVTDPVRDGLVPSWDAAGANITGTSDLNPEAHPVSLVQEAMPDVKTIGVLYSSSESNSLAQLDAYKTEAASLGLTLKPQAITSAAEVSVGLAALKGVDAILVPTDNTVVAAITSVVSFGQENHIPVFCADTSTVSLGTVATRGLSYHDLGRRTGEMAVSILRDGVNISTIKPEATTSTELLVNTGAAQTFGLTLPASLTSGATIIETAA
ncbi:MAG: ABC transporter substrate-binding protein [Propionibacteriaceae bacterium]|jgi:putative ABC transport system substrate-binding protein|nr:ABC transporter substrate-binding protein [Propionibacteriaceae bacterium]